MDRNNLRGQPKNSDKFLILKGRMNHPNPHESMRKRFAVNTPNLTFDSETNLIQFVGYYEVIAMIIFVLFSLINLVCVACCKSL